MTFLRVLIAAGFALIGIGGLVLPILPGWIFLIVAALVLFPASRFSASAFNRVEAHMPRFGRILRRAIVGRPKRDSGRTAEGPTVTPLD